MAQPPAAMQPGNGAPEFWEIDPAKRPTRALLFSALDLLFTLKGEERKFFTEQEFCALLGIRYIPLNGAAPRNPPKFLKALRDEDFRAPLSVGTLVVRSRYRPYPFSFAPPMTLAKLSAMLAGPLGDAICAEMVERGIANLQDFRSALRVALSFNEPVLLLPVLRRRAAAFFAVQTAPIPPVKKPEDRALEEVWARSATAAEAELRRESCRRFVFALLGGVVIPNAPPIEEIPLFPVPGVVGRTSAGDGGPEIYRGARQRFIWHKVPDPRAGPEAAGKFVRRLVYAFPGLPYFDCAPDLDWATLGFTPLEAAAAGRPRNAGALLEAGFPRCVFHAAPITALASFGSGSYPLACLAVCRWNTDEPAVPGESPTAQWYRRNDPPATTVFPELANVGKWYAERPFFWTPIARIVVELTSLLTLQQAEQMSAQLEVELAAFSRMCSHLGIDPTSGLTAAAMLVSRAQLQGPLGSVRQKIAALQVRALADLGFPPTAHALKHGLAYPNIDAEFFAESLAALPYAAAALELAPATEFEVEERFPGRWASVAAVLDAPRRPTFKRAAFAIQRAAVECMYRPGGAGYERAREDFAGRCKKRFCAAGPSSFDSGAED